MSRGPPAPGRYQQPRGPKYCGHTYIFILCASGYLREFPNNHWCAGPSCTFVLFVLEKPVYHEGHGRSTKEHLTGSSPSDCLNAQPLLRQPHPSQQVLEPWIGAQRRVGFQPHQSTVRSGAVLVPIRIFKPVKGTVFISHEAVKRRQNSRHVNLVFAL